MTDYLLVKMCEMALRAVKAPKAPKLKAVYSIDATGAELTYLTDRYPALTSGRMHRLSAGTNLWVINTSDLSTYFRTLTRDLVIFGPGGRVSG